MAVRRPFNDRVDDLALLVAPQIRAAFAEVLVRIRSEWELGRLESLIAAGRIDQALSRVAVLAARLGDEVVQAQLVAATRTATFLRTRGATASRFDLTNQRAVDQMRRLRLRAIDMFSSEQVAAARQAMTRGIVEGVGLAEQARAVRDSIGITPYHEQLVENYRRELLTGDPRALKRRLRDRRFDSTTRRAFKAGTPLTEAEIEARVSAYRRRWVNFNAETIARTHSLSAVHSGSDEMYQQAIDSGFLNPNALVSTWRSALRGAHRRPDHLAMHGQTRPFGEKFMSPSGVELAYPGDPDAPLSETARCACVRVTRVGESLRPRRLTFP
jgi:hypothetical protein